MHARKQIQGRQGYKAPRPISGRPSILSSNRLDRAFTINGPNQAWVTDMAHIRTWQGWQYLAVILALYARRVFGRSMQPTLSRELAPDAP
jgi:putative transposase